MPTLPSASVSVDAAAGALSTGEGFCVVYACVKTNADMTPRVYSSAKAILDQHAYSQGLDYSSCHLEETRKPIIFVGLPITTAGVAGSQDSVGMTGTSRPSLAAATGGYLEETEGSVTFTRAGTVGTDQLAFDLSLDGGVTTVPVKLGTASTYTIPYVGIVLSFGAGTVAVGDAFLFRTTAPMWSGADLATARANLAAQQKLSRTWMAIGELANSTFGGYLVTQANAYETAHQRFVLVRGSVKDRGNGRDETPFGRMARNQKRMTGTPTLTFAEVGASGDTCTRDAGSWLTDGFVAGDYVEFTTALNTVSGVIASLSATVITMGTTDFAAEVTAAATVVASPALTFAEVGPTLDTVTRSSGSWLDDGFAVGDVAAFTGTALNNVSGPISALTATVLTYGSTDLAAEVIGSRSVSCVKVQTMASWMTSAEAAFASIASEKRVDLSAGRTRRASPITGWSFRRPFAWGVSTREYQHSEHVAAWRKRDGTLGNYSMTNTEGTVVEFDERTDGGGLAAGFTVARTYGSGPGTYCAMSLTRDAPDSLLSLSHNVQVTNIACTTVQRVTENAIGESLTLNDDGTATDDALATIEERVNSALEIALLTTGTEGPKASMAVWRANRDDILNVVDATLNGGLDLVLNGTLVHINTVVRVKTAGG